MNDQRPSRNHLIAWLLIFGISVAIAILLLLAASVVWLSALTGSFVVSALILGLFFAVIAIIIYLSALRDAMERIRRQAETIYEVARLALAGYEWIAGKVFLFQKIVEGFF